MTTQQQAKLDAIKAIDAAQNIGTSAEVPRKGDKQQS